jgi:membrane protein YqaA with SNARE-associated domain
MLLSGIPTMGGPDIMLLYLCMSAKGALEVILIAFIAALSESLGSVVLLQVARATSDYAQKKLGVPLKWWNSMRKHATRLSPFWLVVLLGMIPPPLPKKPVPIFCGALHIPTSIFVPALTIGRWIGFLVLGMTELIFNLIIF